MLLRSMLFVPGNNMRMIEKSKGLDADAVIFDLEDAVPMEWKETARIFVRDSVDSVKSLGKRVFVRVNSLPTNLTAVDLEAVVSKGLDGIMLPKSESKEDILRLERLIERSETKKGLRPTSLRIIPLIETAKGVINAYELVSVSKRIAALSFGAVDFTRDMGTSISREGIELLYARSHVAIASRAAGVQPIDTVYVDIMDREGLIRDSKLARQLGFHGKMVIHPNQISVVNEIFSPLDDEIRYARRVVEAYRKSEAKGLGAVSVEGEMIDYASYSRAMALLSLAKLVEERSRKKVESART